MSEAPIEEPRRFSDGTVFTYADADECDQLYSTTNLYDRLASALELKRGIARDHLRRSRHFEPTDQDVDLLASSFPLPPED